MDAGSIRQPEAAFAIFFAEGGDTQGRVWENVH
jgi:hypothetical protein